jgi:hypothetical protein
MTLSRDDIQRIIGVLAEGWANGVWEVIPPDVGIELSYLAERGLTVEVDE